MNLVFLDFETQGLDPKIHPPTEVGATFSSPGKESVQYGALIYEPNYLPQTQEIIDLTGITDENLRTLGRPTIDVFSELSTFIDSADFVLAHNASFDRAVYEATCEHHGLPVALPKEGWICTVTEFPWPSKYKCKKLSHLALDHGIAIDPKTLHRAVADTALLSKLVAEYYDFNQVVEFWKTPWLVTRAMIPKPWHDNGKGRDHVKALGFGWQDVWGTEMRVPEFWVKRVKETELSALKAAAAPYVVQVLREGGRWE